MTWLAGLITYGVMPLLGLGLILAVARLIKGPSLADRVVALDLLMPIGIGFLAAYALLSGRMVVLDVAAVLALLAFLSTVAFATYLERRLQVEEDAGLPVAVDKE
jgi:multicomponent Na+:H+ antiporter subunit F